MGTELPLNFHGRHELSQLILVGIKSILCDFTGGGLVEAPASFPPEFSPYVFPFVEFALYPFAVINHSL